MSYRISDAIYSILIDLDWKFGNKIWKNTVKIYIDIVRSIYYLAEYMYKMNRLLVTKYTSIHN